MSAKSEARRIRRVRKVTTRRLAWGAEVNLRHSEAVGGSTRRHAQYAGDAADREWRWEWDRLWTEAGGHGEEPPPGWPTRIPQAPSARYAAAVAASPRD